MQVSLGKHSHKSRMRWLPLGEEVLDRVPVSGCDFVFTVVRPIVNATLHLALYATHTSRCAHNRACQSELDWCG